MRAMARSSESEKDNLHFVHADAYALELVPGDFDAIFAAAWFAHVPRERHGEFLDGIHCRVGRGGRVFLADEMFCLGPSIADVESGDTYETRSLEDGRTYQIVDNKFTEGDLAELFSPYAQGLEIHSGERYWRLSYAVS